MTLTVQVKFGMEEQTTPDHCKALGMGHHKIVSSIYFWLHVLVKQKFAWKSGHLMQVKFHLNWCRGGYWTPVNCDS